MKSILKVVLSILVASTLATTVALAAFISIAVLIARWLPLSLFQASVLVIGSAMVMLMGVYLIVSLMQYYAGQARRNRDDEWPDDDDPEAWGDDDEEEWGVGDDEALDAAIKEASSKVGRNAPCPCGSGRKFKLCCGRTEEDQ